MVLQVSDVAVYMASYLAQIVISLAKHGYHGNCLLLVLICDLVVFAFFHFSFVGTELMQDLI